MCSSEQCKVYEFKDIPHVLISGLCEGSSVRYPVHIAKPYDQSGGVAALFLIISTLDGGQWSASHNDCFTFEERAPNTHCRGDWLGSRASLDTLKKRKVSVTTRS